MSSRNTEFELGGINHLALVSSDMRATIDFYSGVLGMPLVKTLELPGGMGQHFFFDCGGGNQIAFFWFPTAPDGMPGVSAPASMPGAGELTSAVGSMNHVAFHVPVEKFDEYREKLRSKGVAVSPVLNHDDSPAGVSRDVHEGTFVRSFYFQDPDGALLEFACWMREFTDADVSHEPRTAADRVLPEERHAPIA
ncbi:VOC family protein [Amycolatopsis sp. K13G38]|uniref:VOC family protein n=1 Tax=Amycolatopsis acididurans TaxID=2724524 RepID=A0ABX1JGL1_9PSEU|nr:VOC family protein [Amycolatopsis acididurans]NKQ58878.1 VOC family protein [Amycolatopsis acididurans]